MSYWVGAFVELVVWHAVYNMPRRLRCALNPVVHLRGACTLARNAAQPTLVTKSAKEDFETVLMSLKMLPSLPWLWDCMVRAPQMIL